MRVALITGGAGAIGAATARMLAEDGFSVVLADVEVERAQAVADEVQKACEVQAVAKRVDLYDLGSLNPLMDSIKDESGRLDCLVNNAGRTGASKIDAVEMDEWNA